MDTQSKELRKKLSDYEVNEFSILFQIILFKVTISIYKEETAVKDKDLKSQAKELEELKEKLKFKQAEVIITYDQP